MKKGDSSSSNRNSNSNSPAIRTVHQEVGRIAAASKSDAEHESKSDIVSAAAEVAEWASQKGLAELTQMDYSDLLMGFAVANKCPVMQGRERCVSAGEPALPHPPHQQRDSQC